MGKLVCKLFNQLVEQYIDGARVKVVGEKAKKERESV
jgi:hypothetical protein